MTFYSCILYSKYIPRIFLFLPFFLKAHFWMKTCWVIVAQCNFILPFLSAFPPSPLCLDPANHFDVYYILHCYYYYCLFIFSLSVKFVHYQQIYIDASEIWFFKRCFLYWYHVDYIHYLLFWNFKMYVHCFLHSLFPCSH